MANFNFDESQYNMYSNSPISSGNGTFKRTPMPVVSDEMVRVNTEELERINGIEQKKIDLKRQIEEIDNKISTLENSISDIESKYAPKAMSDDDLETKISANRARRIKKDNNSQYQWNWQKNREDAERRFQQNLTNSNNSQTRMKMNGVAGRLNDIRNNIANNFRSLSMISSPYDRKGIINKIESDLDSMQTSYDTLLKTYSPEVLAQFGVSDPKDYIESVKKNLEAGSFSAKADYAIAGDIRARYEKDVRSGTLTDEKKNAYLQELEPLTEKSQEAWALKNEIIGGVTGSEQMSQAVHQNNIQRSIQKSNEKKDKIQNEKEILALSLNEVLKKWDKGDATDEILEKKYTQSERQKDIDEYKGKTVSERKGWAKRYPEKFKYLHGKGLI